MPPAPSLRVLQASIAPQRIRGRRFASHGTQYNEPSGWLFGEKVRTSQHVRFHPNLLSPSPKPPPPGQKRQKEEWENVWYIGMFGTMAVATVLLYYKPDTR
jgi:hypothetical protein